MSKFLDMLTHAILPNRCMFCGEPVEYDRLACEHCASSVARTDPKICLLCGEMNCICESGREIRRLASPFYYEGIAADAVRSLKFSGNLPNAKKLAQEMAQSMVEFGVGMDAECIVFVPMAEKERKVRGYNPAEKLARNLGKWIDLPVVDALEKKRETEKQHTLSARQRRENVIGAYAVRDGVSVQGKRILLLDDVCTTGATLLECAHQLRKSGAVIVDGITAARTRLNDRERNETDYGRTGYRG